MQWIEQGLSLSAPLERIPVFTVSEEPQMDRGENLYAISTSVLWGPAHLMPPLEPIVKPSTTVRTGTVEQPEAPSVAPGILRLVGYPFPYSLGAYRTS